VPARSRSRYKSVEDGQCIFFKIGSVIFSAPEVLCTDRDRGCDRWPAACRCGDICRPRECRDRPGVPTAYPLRIWIVKSQGGGAVAARWRRPEWIMSWVMVLRMDTPKRPGRRCQRSARRCCCHGQHVDHMSLRLIERLRSPFAISVPLLPPHDARTTSNFELIFNRTLSALAARFQT